MVKKVGLAFALVIAVISFCPAISAQEKKEPARNQGSIRGETYSYKYTEQDFADTPAWKIDDGEPPLPLSRAAQIARTNLARFVEGSENWKINRIWLQSLKDDKWFYNISFICSGAQCRNLPTRQFAVMVKMDGTILKPKKIVLVD